MDALREPPARAPRKLPAQEPATPAAYASDAWKLRTIAQCALEYIAEKMAISAALVATARMMLDDGLRAERFAERKPHRPPTNAPRSEPSTTRAEHVVSGCIDDTWRRSMMLRNGIERLYTQLESVDDSFTKPDEISYKLVHFTQSFARRIGSEIQLLRR